VTNSDDPPAEALDLAATEWVVRLTSGDATVADRAAARAWIAQSAQHRAAFEHARGLWQLSGALRSAPPRRQPIYRAAAIVILATGLGFMPQPHRGTDYRTDTAEVREVVLEDSSTVLLDAASAVRSDFSGDQRRVDLLEGEALFDVRHDPRRPFSVHGLGVSATAVGTRYSVRRYGTRADVLVLAGSVAVAAGQMPPLLLRRGQRARFDAGLLMALENDVDVAEALAWRDGRLVFEMAPLAEVVAALNRHRPGHITIANSALEQLPVNGMFQLDQLNEAVISLEQALPLRSLHLTDYLLVLY